MLMVVLQKKPRWRVDGRTILRWWCGRDCFYSPFMVTSGWVMPVVIDSMEYYTEVGRHIELLTKQNSYIHSTAFLLE